MGKKKPDWGQAFLLGNRKVSKFWQFFCKFLGHNKVNICTIGNPVIFIKCKRCNEEFD